MIKPKIAIIFTGGTISMSVDPRIGAAIPTLSSQEILALVTNIDKYADIEVINFSKIPGPHFTPQMMMELKILVSDTLKRKKINGVIVTHGTDTLEETAYLLDLTLDSEKPVIITGAMRNSSELGYDGPSNLAAAVCTAISPHSRNKGVLIVMNNEVNAASEITKTNTLSLSTFKSLDFGPLGIVDDDKVIFHREIISRQYINTNSILEDVSLLKCVAGMNSDLLNYCVDSNVKGIVIEAMGRGNVPPTMVEGIQYALDNNIAVVMVSRCPTGRVLDTYGYYGAGKKLREMGVLLGGDLQGQKARIKLMLALSISNNYNKLKSIIEDNQY
ncbi:MAG: asparaginase [Alkaliphilus sp.]